uniref:Peptidoglycan-recognition protein n=1 Tax=Eisenia andrei TaxID=168636 RepID=A0A9E9JL18_9ANNE|nr:peptidoglycan recognition protein [Eisenia andrei]
MPGVGGLIISMFALHAGMSNDGPICDSLTFVSRSEWGARPPKDPPTHIGHPVNMSFIHHSLSPGACFDKEACMKAVRGIQNFHMDTRGWNDIGYSFLIGGDGRVYEGRGWDIVGAHTLGYNSVALGFCIIGDYTASLPSDAAIQAAKNVIKCGVDKGYIIESYELFGHRDGGYTECPGDALYHLIHSWPNFSRRKIPKHRA